jgi:tetratricopeptide (TPR) repeat protein
MFDEQEFESFDQSEQRAIKAYELYETGALTRALTELEEAIKMNPQNSSLHFNKALTLDALERFEEAIDEYKEALELNPEDLEILNSLAVDYTRSGHYDLSLATFERITSLDPDFEPAYCNRIITYTELGDYDSAEEMFYTAQQINPDCPLCYYNIGNSLFSRGNYKKAIWCWNKTLQLEPTHPQINYRIAQGHWADGNYERARHFFIAHLRTEPGDVEVILDFGLFLLECREIDAAREKFNRILELSPGFAPAYLYLAEIALNEGKYEEAQRNCKFAIENDYQLVGPRYRLAQCLMLTGESAKAADYLRREMELSPEDPEILLSMGSMLLQLNEIESAINCVLQVIDADENNVRAYHYLALASIMRDEYTNAIDFFDQALKIAPKSAEILSDAAQAHLAINDIETACDYARKALDLKPDCREFAELYRHLRLKQFAMNLRKRIAPALGAISGCFNSCFRKLAGK